MLNMLSKSWDSDNPIEKKILNIILNQHNVEELNWKQNSTKKMSWVSPG
jgi:hypothetical protein